MAEFAAPLDSDHALITEEDGCTRRSLVGVVAGAALFSVSGRSAGAGQVAAQYDMGLSSIHTAAAAVESQGLRVLRIPAETEAAIPVSSTVVLKTPGVRISGNLGGSYNRGAGKGGWLEAGAGINRVFDLGASRAYARGENLADNWQVDGVSIRQAVGVPARSVDGIGFTARTNGPDRGAHVLSCSFVGMRDAITIENPDVSVTLASLNIEHSVFQGNNSAVNAKGRVFGIRFVANQCEQNSGVDGVLRGRFCGGITLDDNMLEGQPNVFKVEVDPKFGTSFQLTSKGNYFEKNGGDYVYSLAASASYTAIIGPNYITKLESRDYCLIGGAGIGRIDLLDDQPVTFDNSRTTLEYGSRILNNRQRGYKVRRLSVTGKSPEIVISDFIGLTDDIGDHVHVAAPSSYRPTVTPFGTKPAAGNNEFLRVPLTVAPGDLVALHLLMRAEGLKSGNLAFQAFDDVIGGMVIEWGGSALGIVLNGRWALVSLPFLALASSRTLQVRFHVASGDGSVAVAGIAGRNYGLYPNDGDVSVLIQPVMPRI